MHERIKVREMKGDDTGSISFSEAQLPNNNKRQRDRCRLINTSPRCANTTTNTTTIIKYVRAALLALPEVDMVNAARHERVLGLEAAAQHAPRI
jgi:hypothetical protein